MKEWPMAIIVAVVLAFAFLFWLVEFKGIIPSEVGFGNAKVKFTETQVKDSSTTSATPPPIETAPVKPDQPVVQNALSVPTTPSSTSATTTATGTTTTSTASSTTPAVAKPAGLTPRQAMTKYFQYIQDGQYQAAYNLFKAQESGAQQTYEEFETFWKANSEFKWTVTKDYESGNFAWVDLTINTASTPKPQVWKYSFKRNTQNPDLKPFGFWGVSNIELH